jgi:hypothetical protein
VSIAENIARWLSPDLAKRADRYTYLFYKVDDVSQWCDGEARRAARWCLEQDADHWRPLGAPTTGKLPSQIRDFRDWLYSQRDLQKSTSST